MFIRNFKVVTYDIEIFPNCFHCTCKDTETQELLLFEISNRKNQLTELVDFFISKGIIFCGYNNKHYDDVVLNYIIDLRRQLSRRTSLEVYRSLYKLSKCIIESEDGDIDKFKRWKYANLFPSMDLLTMQFSSKLRVGLKEMQLTMHYKNVQEYSGSFDLPIEDSDIDEMIAYNINDVESTTDLLNRLKEDVKLRLYIEDEYSIPCLSSDGVKIGESILAKFYCDKTGISYKDLKEMKSPADSIALKDVIFPFIRYKNPKLQDVLEDMKKQVVDSNERKGYEKKFVLSNLGYSIGVGGLHSINKPGIFRPNENEYIGHSDVASMYPSLLIKYNLTPSHLGKEFLQVYTEVYDDRINAKHSHNKLKDKTLKLTLNAVTGKMQEETSWLYDPFNVFRIRINGQLILLMLIERLLELGCRIIQANTDGVMYIAKEENRDRIQEAIHEVEAITQLVFESNDYEAFYQYAINDYFGIIKGYSESKNPELIERKGMFITETKLGKGLAPVVIPKAVINYFLTNQPVREFIKSDKDIKDFVIGQRVAKKFEVYHGSEKVQRINRFYASTNDYYLFKRKYNEKYGDFEFSYQGYKYAVKKYTDTNLLTESGVTILNTYDEKPIEHRHINYQYYISKASKIINELKSVQLSLFDDQTC
jgi:phage DNA polymerase|nr:MAG TPA: DNA polymerase [Crassvirales sp.]